VRKGLKNKEAGGQWDAGGTERTVGESGRLDAIRRAHDGRWNSKATASPPGQLTFNSLAALVGMERQSGKGMSDGHDNYPQRIRTGAGGARGREDLLGEKQGR